MNETAEHIQRQIETLVRAGAETGVQVAAYQDGRLVVDAVAGMADPVAGRPLASGTPIFSFSTGKNVTATLAHLLVAHGLLEYETLVTDVWPEFGAHGKGTATLRHVLTHTVGLPAMPREITPDDLADWPKVCAALAAAEPLWQPGTAMGYHSYTFGYLVGELARRTTGRTMSELLQEWITVPLGIEGQLYFAAPEESLPARLDQDAREWPAAPDDDDAVLAPWESGPSAEIATKLLHAEVPSVCSATAYGLATMFDAVLQRDLVDPAPAFEGVDQVYGTPARMALGFPIGRVGAAPEENSRAFGWPGGGGSYAYADPATGTTFAVTKNHLTPNFDTAVSLATTIRRTT